jgi:hypothetical protein
MSTATCQVAETIYQQIGRRAFLMMGTSQVVGGPLDLTWNVKGVEGINRIRVTLDVASDTYTVDFANYRKLTFKVVKSVSGVYADMLHSVIENKTGLYLSL